jgi:hypothetical protein
MNNTETGPSAWNPMAMYEFRESDSGFKLWGNELNKLYGVAAHFDELEFYTFIGGITTSAFVPSSAPSQPETWKAFIGMNSQSRITFPHLPEPGTSLLHGWGTTANMGIPQRRGPARPAGSITNTGSGRHQEQQSTPEMIGAVCSAGLGAFTDSVTIQGDNSLRQDASNSRTALVPTEKELQIMRELAWDFSSFADVTIEGLPDTEAGPTHFPVRRPSLQEEAGDFPFAHDEVEESINLQTGYVTPHRDPQSPHTQDGHVAYAGLQELEGGPSTFAGEEGNLPSSQEQGRDYAGLADLREPEGGFGTAVPVPIDCQTGHSAPQGEPQSPQEQGSNYAAFTDLEIWSPANDIAVLEEEIEYQRQLNEISC